MPDAGYHITRRIGQRASVVQVAGSVSDPFSGQRTVTVTTHNVRRVAKEATSFQRIVKSREAGKDCGDTTFTIWSRDVPFTRLTAEDYIVVPEGTFQIVTCQLAGRAIVCTAKTVVGRVGKAEIALAIANGLAFVNAAEDS